MAILPKNGSLGHHLFDVFVDREESVENLPWPFGGETGLVLDGRKILLGLLLNFLQSSFDPGDALLDVLSLELTSAQIIIEHSLEIGIVSLVAGPLVVDGVGKESVETKADQIWLADLA